MSAPAAHDPVRVAVAGGLAVIELDNPPVNALYGAIRDRIAELMPQLNADPAVGAILFTGAGRAFSAGVDLKRTAGQAEPFFFHAALDAMDRVAKPLLAAIHGPALGGGLELALACHYRCAGPDARFGLPEVEVGIIPGACGTQRLPRLISLERALGVAALGDLLDPAQALELGLVDALLPDAQFRAAALAWAGAHIGAGLRRTRSLAVKAPADPGAAFDRALRRACAERPGETAPLKAIEAVRACLHGSFDEGVAIERALVSERKGSAEAKAMRYLFFAERACGKVDAAPRALARLCLTGSRAGQLAGAASAAGIAIEPAADVAVHAIGAGEAAVPHAITAVLPADARGVVELAVPRDIDDAVLAALARLLRPFGRALVIGRGALLSARLRAAHGGGAPGALADAGERAIADRVAERAGDIDVLCVMALGYPRRNGGPMYQRALGTQPTVNFITTQKREIEMPNIETYAKLTIHHGQLPKFEQRIAAIMDAVQGLDTGTLRCDCFINEQKNESVVMTVYRDEAAMSAHQNHARDAYHALLECCDMSLAVLSALSPEGLAALSPFKPQLFRFADGLNRSSSALDTVSWSPGKHIELYTRFEIHQGKLHIFKEAAAAVIALVKKNDTATLRYDWFYDEENSQCVVMDTYANADGMFAHMKNAHDAHDKLLDHSLVITEFLGKLPEVAHAIVARYDPNILRFHLGLKRDASK